MTLNIENGISALKQQIGRATYSMYGSRNFSDGTCDCSGAVYYGLTNGGVKPLGYIPSTETMHQWLLDNNYKLIAENSEWKMQAQDVIIWGRKGESAGAGGHTGIAVDGQNWIECTAWSGGGNGAEGGVIISNHDSRWAMNGCPYFYVYRSQQNSSTSDPTQTNLNNTIEYEEEEMHFIQTVDTKRIYMINAGMYSWITDPGMWTNYQKAFPKAPVIPLYQAQMEKLYRKNV
ncbi:peptidoglycan amidohydrolase family protein [Lactococcus lactis]|uniref:peptidoglycan amidohydrolase family protein n=1 Tax=Lactococcus lactis TaxID=1358 RepID=UPI00223B44CA|nr:peptidoglycan amidohydrolase family protein [Lactococcus lactis]